MAQQQARLPASTSVGEVNLTVKDLARSLAFYRDILGYTVDETSDGMVRLTDGSGHVSFVLRENPDAQPKPRRTSGLFHAAILLPTRTALRYCCVVCDASGRMCIKPPPLPAN